MKTCILFLLMGITIAAAAQNNSVQLFNSTNLDAWYAFDQQNGKQTNALKLFSVEDSVIKLYGAKPGYLMSKQSFQNFKLTAEYRWNLDSTIVAASKKKNSGLMYLVPETTPDELWPQGFQFQIKEGATGDIILLKEVTLVVKNETKGPGASVAVSRWEDAENDFGEWNQIEIESVNGQIIQKLNDEVVLVGENPSVNSGRILLQYEGFPIDFRSIEIQIMEICR